jgi:hypothetical protein
VVRAFRSLASLWTAQRRPKRYGPALPRRDDPGQSRLAPENRDFIYFFPLYTGMTIPYSSWRARMWLDTWI